MRLHLQWLLFQLTCAFLLRRHMMEEQERREWAFRESEISALQRERMDLLRKKLQQRESKHQELNERRLEHLW